jgi:hypothetical protein
LPSICDLICEDHYHQYRRGELYDYLLYQFRRRPRRLMGGSPGRTKISDRRRCVLRGPAEPVLGPAEGRARGRGAFRIERCL